MKFSLASKLRGHRGEAIVLGWFSGQSLPQHPMWSSLPASTATAVQRYLRRPGVDLEWGSMHAIQVPRGPWPNVVVIGLGKKSAWTLRRNRLALRRLTRLFLSHRWSNVIIAFQRLTPEFLQQDVENIMMAAYDYRAHKQAPKSGWPAIKHVTLVAEGLTDEHAIAVRIGTTVAMAVNQARDLANTPGGLMTPRVLAQAAGTMAKSRRITVRALTPTDLRRLKMGAILGVGHGSDEPPRFIIMTYKGGKKNARPLVLVGKGITFDSGGYNLKPSNAMSDMHMDMSGGAAVIHALAAIADARLPLNVVGLVPAAENMVSGSGFRPGDILTSMSGLHIEVGNTDAEGRLVLADALTYAQKFYRPQLIVDVATLTGAAVVALGQEASAVLTRREQLQTVSREIGETSGDYVWPLPMWEEYDDLVKATFGDVTNSGRSRWGGAIEGAIFLAKFVQDTPWIHLDIAPTMSSTEGQGLAPGATGVGVRWLFALAQRMARGTLPLDE